MTTTVAAIQDFLLSFNVVEPPFSPLSSITLYKQALVLSQLTNLLIKEGVYTPNNDYEYLWQSIPAADAPNFIFLQAPLPCNLSVMVGGTLIVNATPVDQLFFMLLPPECPPVTNIYLEGRTGGVAVLPMAQNQECPYLGLFAKLVRL